MPTIAIVADDCKSRARYLASKPLPVKYMEDFTVLGFIVSQHEKACTLLRQEGYAVLDCTSGAEVVIENAGQIREIKEFFKRKNIVSSFSDIADTIYQA